MDHRKKCDICYIGTRRARETTYAYRVHDQLVVLPNITAWVCDVCQDVLIETTLLARTEMLLDHMPNSHHQPHLQNQGTSRNQAPTVSRRWSV